MSNLGKAMDQGKLKLPGDAPLPGAEHLGDLAYVIVADEPFPLKANIMRPFPGKGISKEQQILNYRLSRARRIVENAFGILAARWRVYHSKIGILPERVNSIVKATCVLHNFLQTQTTPAQVNSFIREIGDDNNAVL